jgi:phosphate starvation-inducible PhoH-like protein
MARRINRPTKAETREQRKAARLERKNNMPLIELVAEREAREQTRRAPTRLDPKTLKPRTANQALYDQLITTKDLVFGLGVAGTGKTWWSVARACRAFEAGEIERIVCTRPAIESGQSMGYLPGTLEEKFANYFRPVRAALEQFLGTGHANYLIEHGRIQVAPLEFIRGETFSNCWVIADEMQNATVAQHKLLLSRFGENCKMVLNGDPEQCDLPRQDLSGLLDAWRRMRDVPGVGAVEFSPEDIVRSGMCKAVILAYRNPAPQSAAPTSERYIVNESESDNAGLMRMLKAG